MRGQCGIASRQQCVATHAHAPARPQVRCHNGLRSRRVTRAAAAAAGAERDTSISAARWQLWDALMKTGFSSRVVPSGSPFGVGLAWDSDIDGREDNSVVATVPTQYTLSDSLSTCFCPGLSASPAMQEIYAKTNSWEIKLGAALLWAVYQGPNLLDGFWATYAHEFMPRFSDLSSTLTMCPTSELRLVEDTRLVHKTLGWQSAVREVYDTLITGPSFVAECRGTVPSYEQFLWSVACAESRSYSIEMDGQEVTVVAPLLDLANHRHGAHVGARLQPSLSAKGGHIELHAHDVLSCSSTNDAGDLRVRTQPGSAPLVHFFSNYGDKSTTEILDQYGFVVPGNPLDRLALDKQYPAALTARNSIEDPAHENTDSHEEPGAPPMAKHQSLVFRMAEHMSAHPEAALPTATASPLGNSSSRISSRISSSSSSSSSKGSMMQLANSAVAAVSAALQNPKPGRLESALKDLAAATGATPQELAGGAVGLSARSGATIADPQGGGREGSGNGSREWYWWWRADEAVLEELLCAVSDSHPSASAENVEAVRALLAPYFCAGPVRMRLYVAACSLVEARGWRTGSGQRGLESEKLCICQAEEHVQQTLRLAFSSPSPVKEVMALVNLDVSGDATSSNAVAGGGWIKANTRSVVALLNRVERKQLAGTALALYAALKSALRV